MASKNDIDKILKDLYYNLKNPSSFSNAGTLYKAAKKKIPNLKLKQVSNWYNSQRVANLLHAKRNRFKRNPIVVKNFGISYQLDILDLARFAKSNKNYKYILVCIDAFSRLLTCYEQKTKSGEETLNNLKKLVKKFPTIVSLCTDEGGEFVSAATKRFLKDKSIDLYIARNTHAKASLAERVNKTIRTKFLKIFTHSGKQNWLKSLKSVVRNYNNSTHRTLGVAPNDVNTKNVHLLRRKLYPKLTKVEINYQKNVLKKFAVGSTVRLTRIFGRFEKNAWTTTDELFTIKRQVKRKIPVFQLVDSKGEDILGEFYSQELLLVKNGN